jgi:protein-S-isoprenylcysteine O-methyltransferase Ste14
MGIPQWGRIVSGVGVGGCGLALAITARVLFKRSGQDPAPWKPSPSMIMQGPYRFTRNPMYVGLSLFMVGPGLLLDDLWVLALCLPALAVVHFTAVIPEEAYLIEKFGDEYVRYRQRVRRYL